MSFAHQIFRFLIAPVILTLVLSSCSSGGLDTSSRFAMRPMFLRMPGEDGTGEEGTSKDYNEGFRDGCETSIGVVGWGPYRLHGFRYDINRGMANPKYYEGMRLGADACAFYTDSGVF